MLGRPNLDHPGTLDVFLTCGLPKLAAPQDRDILATVNQVGGGWRIGKPDSWLWNAADFGRL